MTQKRIFGWLTLDMAIFVAANAFLILCFGDRLSALNDIGYFKLLVFGLAVFRAANILSNEAVTKPLRAPFVEESRKGGKLVQQPKKTGFMGAMGLLIYCPSCTGVWLATALVYFYVFYPAPTFVVALFLALSAVERLISVLVERLKNKS
jgi:hypothetical protein